VIGTWNAQVTRGCPSEQEAFMICSGIEAATKMELHFRSALSKSERTRLFREASLTQKKLKTTNSPNAFYYNTMLSVGKRHCILRC
jgi:hypothetical protein